MKQTKSKSNANAVRNCRYPIESLEGRYSPSSFFILPLASLFDDYVSDAGETLGNVDRIVESKVAGVSKDLQLRRISDQQVEHSYSTREIAPRVVDEILSNEDESFDSNSLIANGLRKMGRTGPHGKLATYEVTITNLTDGQPFAPPIMATHRAATDIFTVGEAAGVGIQQIAENGNNAPLIEALANDKHVHDIVEASAPLVPASDPGGTGFDSSVTLTVTSARGAKLLSLSTMLICTNDGFTGLDSVRLPNKVGDVTTIQTAGYDAGTELNTEDFADIVPPCQGLIGISSDDMGTGTSDPELAEGGVITHHTGIMGGNDLVPGIHGWTDPVAEIVITRVS